MAKQVLDTLYGPNDEPVFSAKRQEMYEWVKLNRPEGGHGVRLFNNETIHSVQSYLEYCDRANAAPDGGRHEDEERLYSERRDGKR
jgi:hypothetical protein